jgi:hypothetical protein
LHNALLRGGRATRTISAVKSSRLFARCRAPSTRWPTNAWIDRTASTGHPVVNRDGVAFERCWAARLAG